MSSFGQRTLFRDRARSMPPKSRAKFCASPASPPHLALRSRYSDSQLTRSPDGESTTVTAP